MSGLLSRRQLLSLSSGLATLVFTGCSRKNAAALGNPIPVRTKPVKVPIQPLAAVSIDAEQLNAVGAAMAPPTKMEKFPIAWVYHALRLWGCRAGFGGLDFRVKQLRGRWGQHMLQVISDDSAFAEFCAADYPRYLFKESPYGVFVRTSWDDGYGSEWASTHPGKYVQVMAELDIPSTHEIRLFNGRRRRLADVICDDARRLHLSIELEWTTVGLSRYLSVSQWQNRFGQWISFDQLASRLIDQGFGQGSCFGCHVPFALATLLAVAEGSNLLSAKTIRHVTKRLAQFSASLAETQLADGSWGPDWPVACGVPDYRSPLTWRSAQMDTLCVTGHHLEWMTITPPSLRPAERVMERAARYLIQAIISARSLVEDDWHFYSPVSHAAKAVTAAAGYQFAQWKHGAS
jgi:hypothetical protein